MSDVAISLYKNIKDVNSTARITLDLFLSNIKEGIWQDNILKYRTEKNEERKRALKKNLPNVTISGKFSSRFDKNLESHSGFICIDLDKIDDVDMVKSQICADEHLYAAFTSTSGNGLALIFKITPTKHADAFYGLSKYLLDNYQLVADSSCVNVSRARFVSFDPDLFINPSARKFTQYIKKPKRKISQKKIVHVQNDFELIVKTLQEKRIDITYHYPDWLHIGFAFADKFGESGRSYFHAVSELSDKYDYAICDKQFDSCIKHRGQGRTMATFYYLAKQAGVQIQSSETREIIKLAATHRRAAIKTPQQSIETLKEFTDLDHALIDEIVPQVDEFTVPEDVTAVELLETELVTNYEVRFNIVSRYYETRKNGQWINMDDIEYNSMYLDLIKQKTFEKISFPLFERILHSGNTPSYNPLLDFFARNKEINPVGCISNLAKSIVSDFGLDGDYKEIFIRKWLVACVASAHGELNDLMLILAGSTMHTGKTTFLKKILPESISKYKTRSTLMGNVRDSEMLLARQWIIIIDELEGGLLSNTTKFKSLMSSSSYYLREPYGKNFVTINRLACLCGTSNDYNIIPVDTGNRRIIPIHVSKIDRELYNSIDKTALWMEAYHLYISGYDYGLNQDLITILENETNNFEEADPVREIIFEYFTPANDDGLVYSSTEIASHIQMKAQVKLSTKKIGTFLKSIGLERVNQPRTDGFKSRKKGYRLIKHDISRNDQKVIDGSRPFGGEDDNPFELVKAKKEEPQSLFDGK